MNFVRHAALIAAYRQVRRDQLSRSGTCILPTRAKVTTLLKSAGFSDDECVRMWSEASASCVVNLLDLTSVSTLPEAYHNLKACGYRLNGAQFVAFMEMLRADLHIVEASGGKWADL
ncbi:hypothetical protein AD940_01155 [Gluconobacter thailandicus]|uniref:hypothetical protein n=1 Tax=Gluconobacter thailandicus TaxID=257438 RepID=UPI000777E07A|nr:hypothetical protein [Gluconobacter thailandicus]KXV35909.1 hypothetical protein AD940_01155 [Gluconobacter thailandicus]